METGASPSAGASPQDQRILYCLDFDGVLCDSVHETFLSGWKACKLLWNDKNDTCDWMDAYENDPQKMQQLEDDFRFVRPILYVGWEAILLIRLLAVAYTEEIAGTTVDVCNPLSTKDAVFRGFHNASSSGLDFRDHALSAWGFSVSDYGDAMSTARTTWIEENESSWIDAHGFYEGACRAVKNYLEMRGGADVYIITTKAKEFALRLLEKQDLFQSNTPIDASNNDNNNNTIDETHVFGLGSGPKASVLQQILEARQGNCSTSGDECVAVMVEDNIATLEKISKSPVGDKVLPVVASWGYNSIQQLSSVLQASTNGPDKQSHVVLPMLLESYRISECEALKLAERAKQRDPTGCSIACILQSPCDAGKLLPPLSRVVEDELYDFSSTQNIALVWFREQLN